MNYFLDDFDSAPVVTLADLPGASKAQFKRINEAWRKIISADMFLLGPDERPTFPPTEDYSCIFGQALLFCNLLSQNNFDHARAIASADLIEKNQHALVLDDETACRCVELTLELLGVVQLAACVKKLLSPKPAPAIPTFIPKPEKPKMDRATNRDLDFANRYKDLRDIREFTVAPLLKYGFEADSLLLNCIDLALGIASDYLHGLDVTSYEATEVTHTAKEVSDEIGPAGGDMKRRPYSYVVDAMTLIELVQSRTEKGIAPSGFLRIDCGVLLPERTPGMNKRARASHKPAQSRPRP